MNSIATAKFSCLVPSDDGKRGQLPCCCPPATNVPACPHPRRARRLFLTFDQGPAQTLPFPAATIRLNGLAAGALRQKRATASFSRPSPTIFVFQRLADIAQLADFGSNPS